MPRQLKPEFQEVKEEFENFYEDRGCSCHLAPPCSYCTHEGNPSNLENDECWEVIPVVGDRFEMAFPFHVEGFAKHRFWVGGCEVHDETYEPGIGERFFTAHGEGKVIYEVLSIAEMPGRYMDRVVFKRSTINPDGNTANPGEIRVLTVRKFIKHVTSRTPFPVEYELEAAQAALCNFSY